MSHVNWVSSAGYAFLWRCQRQGLDLKNVLDRHSVWKRLNAEALPTRMRIILAPWFRRREEPRRRIVPVWRFADGSFVVSLFRAGNGASLEVLSAAGVTAALLRDSRHAVAAALRSGHPVYEELVEAHIGFHAGLPRLDFESRLAALQAESRVIRLAAVTGLRHRDGDRSRAELRP